jgi:putative hemolysin
MTVLLQFIVIIVTLALNGVFSAYEMALASVSRARLHVLEGRRVKGAVEAVFMKENMEASLAVLQLGITLLGAVAAATGGLSAADLLSPYLMEKFRISNAMADVIALVVIVIPLSAATIVFAELVPKMVALNDRERVCLGLSPFMRRLFQVFSPVVRLLERVVKWVIAVFFRKFKMAGEEAGLHELHAAAALARTSRLIGAREEKIVVAAAQLSSRRVREIMIAVNDICTIPVASTLSEALIRAHMDMHTRFPVCAGGDCTQHIEGYINFKDIIAALRLNPSDPTVKGIVRPIRSIDPDVSIASALEKMIQENLHIMLVTAKEKGVIGMITLEDIIEELVGDIEDEFDRFPSYVHAYAGGWIVGGGVTMGMLAQVMGRPVVAEAEMALRFTDWCSRYKEGAFEGGETVEADRLVFTVRKLRRHKVGEAAVSLK